MVGERREGEKEGRERRGEREGEERRKRREREEGREGEEGEEGEGGKTKNIHINTFSHSNDHHCNYCITLS